MILTTTDKIIQKLINDYNVKKSVIMINRSVTKLYLTYEHAGCVYTILTELLLADGRADPCANCNEALRY